MKRRLMLAISVTTVMIVAAACGGGSSGSSGGGGSGSSSTPAGDIQDGGSINIARTQESQGMDNTNVFDNESIWIFEQMLRDALHGLPGRQERDALAGHQLRRCPPTS